MPITRQPSNLDTPELAPDHICITRYTDDDTSGSVYQIVFRGKLVPFTMVDPKRDEFRPLSRYDIDSFGVTRHVIESANGLNAVISVDSSGSVVEIMLNNEYTGELHLPVNHVFFTHVRMGVMANEVL